MKQSFLILLILFFLFLLPLSSYATDPASKKPTINVAALLALSGGIANQGQWSRRGIELAVDDVSAAKKVDLNVIYEDTRAEPRLAVDAYKSLSARAPLPAMITLGSGVGMALSPLSNQDRVVQVGVATGTPKYSSKNDFTFRTYPSSIEEGSFLAKATPEQLHKTQIAMLSIQNDYGEGVAQVFRERLSADKAKVVIDETFLPGETDFRTMLLKLKKSPEVLFFVISYPSEGALLIKQARELGLENQILATSAIIGDSSFFETIGKAAEGITVAFPFEDPSITRNETMRSFYNRYLQKYGTGVGIEYIYSAVAYDAVLLLANALEHCPDGAADCIREQLQQTRNFSGATQKITFDENGDVSADYRFVVIRNGAFKNLD